MGFCLDRQRPLARKAHFCDVCFGTIGIGDTYTRERNIGDDGPYVFKAHSLCDAAYWKAHSDLGLYSDDTCDWFEDVKPIVEAVFANLATVLLHPAPGPESTAQSDERDSPST